MRLHAGATRVTRPSVCLWQVKPENILVTGADIKLIDFGGASTLHQGGGGAVWSTECTVSHAAPELNQFIKDLNARKDSAARTAYDEMTGALGDESKHEATHAWTGKRFDPMKLIEASKQGLLSGATPISDQIATEMASDAWAKLKDTVIRPVHRAIQETKTRFIASHLVTPQVTDVWAWACTVLQLHTGEFRQQSEGFVQLFAEYNEFCDLVIEHQALRWTSSQLVSHLQSRGPSASKGLAAVGPTTVGTGGGMCLGEALDKLPSIALLRAEGLRSGKHALDYIKSKCNAQFKVAHVHNVFMKFPFKALISWFVMPPPLLACLRHCFHADPTKRPSMSEAMAACASAAPWIGATLPLTTTTLPEPLSTEQLTESLYTIARVPTATKGQLALAEEVCLEILGHQPYHSDAKAKLKLVRALINKSLAAAVEEEQTQHEPKSLGDCDTVLSPAPAPAPGAPAFAPVAAAPLAPDPAHAAAGPQPPPSASGPSPPPLPAKEEFSSDTAQAPGASSFGSGTTETLAGIGSKFDSELMSKRKEALMQDCPALNPPSMMQAVLTKQADVLVEEVLAQAGPQFELVKLPCDASALESNVSHIVKQHTNSFWQRMREQKIPAETMTDSKVSVRPVVWP